MTFAFVTFVLALQIAAGVGGAESPALRNGAGGGVPKGPALRNGAGIDGAESPALQAAAEKATATPIEVVVFSDFQCPFCAQFAGPFRELQTKGLDGAKVTVQFKHFPIASLHPAAPLVHQAALAAQAQGKFWEMHDLLFANRARAQRPDLLGHARTLGLDLARFERDMDSDAVKRAIAADLAEGTKRGVNGTPTFFINGQGYSGTRTLPQLQSLIAGVVAPDKANVSAGLKPPPYEASAGLKPQPYEASAGLKPRPYEASAGAKAPALRGEAATAPATVSTDVPVFVDLVLYSDFQCPFCQQFSGPFRELQTKGADGTKVNVTFKHFPLSIHPNAQLAHQAAKAAEAQGKFWEMHDVLFANPQRVQRADLLGYAKQLGLDVARFEQDLDSDAVKQAIAADVAEGAKAGVSGTPSYSIDGKMYSGTRTLAQMKETLGGAQRRARAMAEIGDAVLSKGPAGAPVTIELFADLQSPVSRPAMQAVEQVARHYPSAVRIQFRNFPLAFHPQAGLAHEAAMIAARDGRFWEMAAFVLDHQDALREQDLIAEAGRIGLDTAKFAAALQERRYKPRVDADVSAGQGRGVRGSPAILIGDKRIDGVPNAQTLAQYVELALAVKQAETAVP